MKVVQLTPWYPPYLGGVELHVKSISEGLRRLGCEVQVFTFSETNEKNAKTFGFLRVPAPHECFSIMPSPSILSELLHSDADLIHAHSYGYPMAWIAAIARKLRGTPFVYTLHSDPYSRVYPLYDAGRLLPVKLCDLIIATTRFEEEHLNTMGIPTTKIRVIPQGLEVGIPGPRTIPEPYILCLGRMVFHHKGQDMLLKAFQKGGFSQKLVFAGDGIDLPKLKQMADRDPNVIILGTVRPPEKWSLLGNADLVVMPSRLEPYGHVALEALALGRRLVVTRVGGLQYISKPYAMVAEPNPDGIAKAMHAALTQDFGPRNFSAPSWQEIATKTLAVYNEVVELKADS